MKNRTLYIEGLRGIMSLNVLFNHFIVVFYPELYFVSEFKNINNYKTFLARSPISIFYNGNVAVIYFFLISGFFFARSMFINKYSFYELIIKNIKRFKNLLNLVLISILFAWILMKFKLMFHYNSIGLGVFDNFLKNYNFFTPTIKSLIVDVPKTFINGSSYVGPLWTMKYELFGTILISIVVYILKEKKYRRIIYAILSVLVYPLSIYYSVFLLSAFLADIFYYTLELKKYDTTLLSSDVLSRTWTHFA